MAIRPVPVSGAGVRPRSSKKVIDSDSEDGDDSFHSAGGPDDEGDDFETQPKANPKGSKKPTSKNGQVAAVRQESTSANKRRLSGQKLSIIDRPPPQQLLKAMKEGVVAPSLVKQIPNMAKDSGLSREAMNTNFEEWMKMATDNKITATNTWNFALIDYFADLTLLRNGPNDQSINFQKASCTLDGCVKIYNSRVDSVATETGKLLSGLAGGGDKLDDDEAADDQDGDGEGADGNKKEKRKTARSEQTLAKSFAALSVKKFDLEFSVDPLFKKTSADFDEGGAMGLLMNHLSIDKMGRVVFDAGDVEMEDEDEEEDEDDLVDEDGDEMDLGPLAEFIPEADVLASRSISTTLADFKFSADPNHAFNLAFMSTNDDDDDVDLDASANHAGGPVADFFGDDDLAPAFDGGDDYMGDGGIDGGDDGVFSPEDRPAPMNGSHGTILAPFDPARQASGDGLVMTMLGAGEESMMLDYFDQGYLKNWAGPEHWKLRRVTKKADPTSSAAAISGGGDVKARKEKIVFSIDFESEKTISTKEIFASAPNSSISIANSRLSSGKTKGRRKLTRKNKSEEEPRENHLLPDDMHFSSRELLTLFLKPKFVLRMRRQRTSDDPMPMTGDGEVDENFWAQAAADRADGDDGFDDGDMGMASQPAPFESQFFHDDVDDGASFAGVEDALGLDMGGLDDNEDDLMAASQAQIKKIRPETVHYAKRAKRVDVKRLKDNIWKGLNIAIAAPELQSDSDDDEPKTPTAEKPQPEITGERVFDAVISNLRDSYPAEKMSEISTSFCFICLLHLANEQGLKIEAARLDDDEGVTGNIGYAEGLTASGVGKTAGLSIDEHADSLVGELQALKITKDPYAGQAE